MAITFCGKNCKLDSYGPCTDPKIEFEGAVLDIFERNGYDDSDFLAVVWDGERVRTIEYGTTRFWTYHNRARVDATPEVIEKALAWWRPIYAQNRIDRERRKALEPAIGKRVRSLTTRGKAKGAVGTIGVISNNGYGLAAKIDTGEAQIWVALDRVEVIDPPEIDTEAILKAAETVTPHNWRSAIWPF